jgi:hypothetical protein
MAMPMPKYSRPRRRSGMEQTSGARHGATRTQAASPGTTVVTIAGCTGHRAQLALQGPVANAGSRACPIRTKISFGHQDTAAKMAMPVPILRPRRRSGMEQTSGARHGATRTQAASPGTTVVTIAGCTGHRAQLALQGPVANAGSRACRLLHRPRSPARVPARVPVTSWTTAPSGRL